MKKILATVLLLATVSAHAQYATAVKSTEVAPGIYYIEGVDGMAGGSITLLLGEDHVALIDGGYHPVAPALLEHIAEIAGRPVDFMINTHVHGDHTGANAAHAAEGTVIFAHENIRKRLLDNPDEAGGPGGLPVITYADGVTFYLNGIAARAHHVANAHTDGDSAVEFPDINVVHAGDLLFNLIYPYIDLDNGGSVAGVIAYQRDLLERVDDETIIIPGHGALASKKDLEKNLLMLTDSQARVKMLVDQGRTIEEVLTEGPLSVYHEQFDWQFISTERMTRMLYRSLTEGE
jgi:glyoxylase-like metal-dependent hydrolase (beta-lactamase superfamily II)